MNSYGADRILFQTDFGLVPMNPKVHIDLVNDMITNAEDRAKIFSTNTFKLLRLAENATRLVPERRNFDSIGSSSTATSAQPLRQNPP